MTSERSVTLRDVAATAGVSIKTASRVLNNHPNVAYQTRLAVKKAMRELNYSPNSAARSLRKGAEQTIGLLIDSIGDVFFSQLAAAVEAEVNRSGFQCMIVSNHRNLDREAAAIRTFVERRCSGIILSPLTLTSLQSIDRGDIPAVFVDRIGVADNSCSVVYDDAAMGYEATDHLIGFGHNRIAVIADRPQMATTAARLQGYCRALSAHQLPVADELILTDLEDAGDVFPAIKALSEMPYPPTAIITTSSRLSYGLIPALERVRRRDIAIVSIGDFPLAGSLSPAVTVINHSAEKLAQAAAHQVISMINSPDDQHYGGVIYLPMKIIPRGSGEISPGKGGVR